MIPNVVLQKLLEKRLAKVLNFIEIRLFKEIKKFIFLNFVQCVGGVVQQGTCENGSGSNRIFLHWAAVSANSATKGGKEIDDSVGCY